MLGHTKDVLLSSLASFFETITCVSSAVGSVEGLLGTSRNCFWLLVSIGEVVDSTRVSEWLSIIWTFGGLLPSWCLIELCIRRKVPNRD